MRPHLCRARPPSLPCLALFPRLLWVVGFATPFPGLNTYSVWESVHLPQSTIILQWNVVLKVIEQGKVLVFNSYPQGKNISFSVSLEYGAPCGTLGAITVINLTPSSVYWSKLKLCFVTSFYISGLISHPEGVFVFLYLFLNGPRMDMAKKYFMGVTCILVQFFYFLILKLILT